VVRFYNNLQDRGECQTTRKSHKTSHFVGCLLEKVHKLRNNATFILDSFRVPDGWSAIREEFVFGYRGTLILVVDASRLLCLSD